MTGWDLDKVKVGIHEYYLTEKPYFEKYLSGSLKKGTGCYLLPSPVP